jgi:hypothetical protein
MKVKGLRLRLRYLSVNPPVNLGERENEQSR